MKPKKLKARIPLSMKKNRVFVDKKKKANKNACRNWR